MEGVMRSDWKPEGYSSVSVYMVAEGAQRVIDFLKQTFNAEALRRFDTPDSKTMHAEVRIGDTVVMIAEASERYPAFPVWLHVYVPDVDATYKKALATWGRFGAATRAQRRRSGSSRWCQRPLRKYLVDFDAEWIDANGRAYCLPARCSRRFELSATPSGTLTAA
jgi:PhnB protein